MTARRREISGAGLSHSDRRHATRDSEVEITTARLVFRPDVRMLNGAGPLNAPMRVLFMDGSPQSLHAFEICQDAGVDFSVEVVRPGEGVVLHDRLLHADFHGVAAIERALAFAKRLYDQMDLLVDEALPEAMQVYAHSRGNEIAKAVEAEREERDRLAHHASTQFSAHRSPQS